MLGSPGLTETHPQQCDTQDGMAYFAGTGPDGKLCANCKHYGYDRAAGNSGRIRMHPGCAMFKALTGRHGPSFAKEIAACKYFEQK